MHVFPNPVTYIDTQERRKALKTGGAKSLNRIDLYGKNSIPMEKLYNLWGPWPPWPPPVPTPM